MRNLDIMRQANLVPKIDQKNTFKVLKSFRKFGEDAVDNSCKRTIMEKSWAVTI